MHFDRLEQRLPIIGPAQGGGGTLSFFRLFSCPVRERHIDGALAELSEGLHARTMWNNETIRARDA